MTVKITQKIVAWSVASADATPPTPQPQLAERPETLIGATYKVKTPVTEHAMYITINDLLADGKRVPFEIFINSKSMEHFQWITALTRIISAVFRSCGDNSFLVEELKAVFDPKGGYFASTGKYMPSIIAEIGEVIDKHMRSYDSIDTPMQVVAPEPTTAAFPSSASLCSKCNVKAAMVMDGCLTCLNCGDSKCG